MGGVNCAYKYPDDSAKLTLEIKKLCDIHEKTREMMSINDDRNKTKTWVVIILGKSLRIGIRWSNFTDFWVYILDILEKYTFEFHCWRTVLSTKTSESFNKLYGNKDYRILMLLSITEQERIFKFRKCRNQAILEYVKYSGIYNTHSIRNYKHHPKSFNCCLKLYGYRYNYNPKTEYRNLKYLLYVLVFKINIFNSIYEFDDSIINISTIQWLDVHNEEQPKNFHPLISLFEIVTEGLSSEGLPFVSTFHHFLICHRLYDPRLLIYIEKFFSI